LEFNIVKLVGISLYSGSPNMTFFCLYVSPVGVYLLKKLKYNVKYQVRRHTLQ